MPPNNLTMKNFKHKHRETVDNHRDGKENKSCAAPWNPYFNWSNGIWAYSLLNVIYPYIDL